jgi:hypothetical protein
LATSLQWLPEWQPKRRLALLTRRIKSGVCAARMGV